MREVVERYDLEAHHLELLLSACEALDRGEQARQAVARSGAYFTDKHGVIRPHPGLNVQAAASRQYQRALRELNLDGAVEERR